MTKMVKVCFAVPTQSVSTVIGAVVPTTGVEFLGAYPIEPDEEEPRVVSSKIKPSTRNRTASNGPVRFTPRGSEDNAPNIALAYLSRCTSPQHVLEVGNALATRGYRVTSGSPALSELRSKGYAELDAVKRQWVITQKGRDFINKKFTEGEITGLITGTLPILPALEKTTKEGVNEKKAKE